MGNVKRHAAATDKNEAGIVKALRTIPGVSVQTGCDDIRVGYQGRNYWYEIKNPSKRKKDGTPMAGALRPGQIVLQREWRGHYRVVFTLEEILIDMGISLFNKPL